MGKHNQRVNLAAAARPSATIVGELETEIVALLRAVPLYCDELGLICKEHCAVDGCRLPTATELFYKLLRRAR